MTTSDGETYLLVCSVCGAKFTASGKTVGGNPSCQHQFIPIAQAMSPPPQKNAIVYPTDAERKWLRIIDQNKTENEKHYNKFTADKAELGRLQDVGMQAISSMITMLQKKLQDRKKELEQELEDAFEEREGKILENMKALKEHHGKNEETKENAEDLLRSNDKPESEREKIIVGDCESIINTTPKLKYVDTKLEYTFRTLNKIEQAISNFGKLQTMPVGSGDQCIFDSTTAATNAPSASAKTVDLDSVLSLQLKNSTFDPKAKKVKLSFKVNPKGATIQGIDDAKKHLKIHIYCAEDDEDQKGEDQAPIYQETVDFSTCKQVKNKWELSINHQFQPGLTVAFKLRPKFATPDDKKWKEAFGKWSREQTIDIPEEEDQDVTFTLELGGKQQQLKLNDDDKALTDFTTFQDKFLAKFGKKLENNEKLLLSTDDGVLTSQSKLTKYATESYIIRGQITMEKVYEEEPPPPAFQIPKIEEPAQEPGGGGGGGGNGGNVADLLASAPKQISTIVVFSDTKKRVVLKKKNNEYTMNTLREKVTKKLKGKGLSGQFALETKDGTRITDDLAIISYLANYEGELKVIKE